jgi:WD40 repeat protein
MKPVLLFVFTLFFYKSVTATAWTVSWSYDDKYVAVGDDNGRLSIYETTNWKKIKTWQFQHTTIARVEWSPKELILAVASGSYQKQDSVIQVYDLANDKVLLYRSDSIQGRCVTWRADGERLAFAGSKGAISIFNKEGKFRKTLSYYNSKSLMDIDWHPTEEKILVVEEDIVVLDEHSDVVLATYDDGSKNKGILTCQWHPSGKFFVIGDYGHENEGAEPSYVRYFDVEGKLLKQVKESKYEYRNVRWSSDGRYLAASGDVLLLLDEKGNKIRSVRFDQNNLWGVEFNHAGNKIILSDGAGNIRLTDLKGNLLKSFRH